MAVKTKIKRQNPTDIYKNRIKALHPKDMLPKKWRRIFLKKFPQYDTASGYALLHNVYNMNTADVFITEELERMSAEHLKEKQK